MHFFLEVELLYILISHVNRPAEINSLTLSCNLLQIITIDLYNLNRYYHTYLIMIVFPKKDIIPIIVPQICFIDKYNDLNSYTEMNPSLFIEEDGTTTILVRCVNYKIFNNKTRCSGPFPFTLHQTNSNSIYYLLKGKIKDTKKVDVENFEYQIVETNLNLQKYLTYWLGLEDIRFLDSNNILVIVPELNMDGKPSIFKAELNNNQITNFISCKPDKIEKNWMPYSYNNLSKVIYSLDPFIIKNYRNR